MDVSRLALNQAVTRTRQGNLPGFLTPDQAPTLQLATVSKLDPGRNEISVVLNDYLGTVVDRVPVLGDVLASLSVGDFVQCVQNAQGLAVLGRQYRPAATVTFG